MHSNFVLVKYLVKKNLALLFQFSQANIKGLDTKNITTLSVGTTMLLVECTLSTALCSSTCTELESSTEGAININVILSLF
jgi:hypothetical protein